MRTAALLALSLLLPAAAHAAPPPAPFSADYDVFQDGSKLGQGRIRLQVLPDGRWEMTTTSNGTQGLAGLAGVRREESSVLRWTGGVPEVVSYRMQQKAGWSTRTQTLQVDAAARRATSTYKDQRYDLAYTPGLLDKHGVTAALMSDLAAGRRGILEYAVAERRDVEAQRYRVAANVRLQTAIGEQRAVRVERLRDDDSGRQTRIWFAREHGWLPLRITQVEADGGTLDMRISAIR